MSKFFLDAEDLSTEERRALGDALAPLAESDLPLVVELVLVDEEEIRRLNREMRGVDRVTDVLSFPAMETARGAFLSSEEHGECIEPFETDGGAWDGLYLGSVAICEKRAREQAEEYGHSYRRELFYLAVHGVLHCLGYDHETESDRAQMREKEESVMQKLGLKRES